MALGKPARFYSYAILYRKDLSWIELTKMQHLTGQALTHCDLRQGQGQGQG